MINHQVTSSNYVRYAWIIISSSSTSNNTSIVSFDKFNLKYGKFIKNLIVNSQLNSSNLIISLYYLFKHYHQNQVLNHCINNSDNNETNCIIIYNLMISLILSNKSLDDQSYTLKTWLIIINNSLSSSSSSLSNDKKLINIDLKLLNYLEGFFLSSLNYELGFKNMNQCNEFWQIFTKKTITTPTSIISTPVIKTNQQQQQQPILLSSSSIHHHSSSLPPICNKKRSYYYDSSNNNNNNSPLSIYNTPIDSRRLIHQFYSSPPSTPVYKKRRTDNQYTYIKQQQQPITVQQSIVPQQQPIQIQYNCQPLPSTTTSVYNFQPIIPPILLTQQQQQQNPIQRQYIYNWS